MVTTDEQLKTGSPEVILSALLSKKMQVAYGCLNMHFFRFTLKIWTDPSAEPIVLDH
jgi:hypothetical protein